MGRLKLLLRYLLAAILMVSVVPVHAQVQVSGTVYDRSLLHPMQGVSVVGAPGVGTVTDSSGRYSIRLMTGDSISFSYLGKATSRFPVKDIALTSQFDISLDIAVDSLPTVLVRSKNYYLDSLSNRREYRRVFDYEGRDYIGNVRSGRGEGFGIGLNLDILLDPKKERRLEALQSRLKWEEEQNYIDHRFTKAVVRRVTGLQSPALDTFMVQYRPSYEYLQVTPGDWEYYKYILDSGRFFARVWKQAHPDDTSADHVHVKQEGSGLKPAVQDSAGQVHL